MTTTGYISDLIPLILRLLLFIFYSFANFGTPAVGAEGVPSSWAAFRFWVGSLLWVREIKDSGSGFGLVLGFSGGMRNSGRTDTGLFWVDHGSGHLARTWRFGK